MDSGSCYNFCSTRLAEKHDLQVIPHPKHYKLQWLNEDGDENYKDDVLCDVVPMEVCISYWEDQGNLKRKLPMMVLPTR